MSRGLKWLSGLMIMLFLLTGCMKSSQSVNDHNKSTLPTGTYYYQDSAKKNHIIDINKMLVKIGNPKNPYQGITFKRIDSNVVQVLLNNEVVPKLYEINHDDGNQTDLNDGEFDATLVNYGEYVGNVSPKNYQSAINYATAMGYNDQQSLSKSVIYDKLIHKGRYRPAFDKKVAKRAVDKVFAHNLSNTN